MTQGYNESSTQIFYGLSSDTKPTGCDNGSIFIEMDTKIGYIYDAANADWTEIPNGGGSQVEMDYNEATNKPAINDVTLSGNKTPASLGLQTKINSDSMLDADLVDDTNSDNKFVSATDIVNWNGKANADDVYTKTYMDTALAGKQPVIDDLSDIRSGAALGATSLQPTDVKSTYSSTGTDPVNGTAVAAAIGTLDVAAVGGSGSFISGISETNGKISATAGTVDSTPTESSTGLVTSAGIYTDQVRQDTLEAQDRAALVEVENKGAKNILKTYDIPETASGNVVFSIVNGVCSVSTTDTQTTARVLVYAMDAPVGNTTVDSRYTIPRGTYILKTTGNGKVKLRAIEHDGTNTNLLGETTGADVEFTYSGTMPYVAFTLSVSSNASLPEAVTFIPMCCLKAEYIIDQTAVKYGKTNPELTLLERQDRDGLTLTIDKGAKNLLKNELGEGTKSGLAYTTGTDGSISITAGTPTANADFVIPFTPTESGQYVLTGCPDGGSGTPYKAQIALYPSMTNVVDIFSDTSATANLTAGTDYAYRFRVYSGKEIGNATIYPMVCRKEEYDISNKYVPYGMDNPELTSIALPSRDAIKAMDKTYSKNIADLSKTPNRVIVRESDGVTVTLTDDNTILASGTSGSGNNIFFNIFYNDTNTVMVPSGTWVAKLYGTGSENFRIEGSDSVHTSVYRGDFGKPFEFTVADGVTYSLIRICARPDTDFTGTSMKLMICSKGEWDISQDYVPYGMTNLDLTTFTRAVANRGSKNVAEVTAVSSSAGGVDYTVNPDGTVIANRTSSSTSSTWFRLNPSLSLKAGTYILSGGKSANERVLVATSVSLSDTIADSQGNEVTFTLTQDTDNLIYAIRIAYTDSPSNVKFYPMIRPVEMLDSTYQPFAKTNSDLTAEADYAVNTGVKNLLNVLNAGTFPKTVNGVTYNESNGVITTSDAATITTTLKMPITLDAGSYIISGCPANGSDSTYRIDMRLAGTNTVVGTNDYGNGFTLNVTTKTDYDCCIRFYQGVSAANLTFKPMIRSAAITAPTFQPFARTNPELTVLTDEDRASLVELVDGGSKNIATINNGNNGTLRYIDIPLSATAGDYVLNFGSLVSTDTDATTCNVAFFLGDVRSSDNVKIDRGTNITQIVSTTGADSLRVYASDTSDHSQNDTVTISDFMVCTTAAWKISQAYQPYRPSWQEMWDAIQALQNSGNRALMVQNLQPTEPEEQKELELTKSETEEVKEEVTKIEEPEVKEDIEIKDDISSDLER